MKPKHFIWRNAYITIYFNRLVSLLLENMKIRFFCLILSGLVGVSALKAQVKNNDLAFDYAPDVEDSVIIKRIASLNPDIPITFNDKVRSFIDYFSIKRRDYTRLMIARQKTFFPMIESYLEKHDMPKDLKYLTIVESGINPKAKSRAGALGLWQFMPSTGKMFKLNYDYYVDERMDPYKATEAACLYLKELYRMFNDWELALAAYNCGPGNVRRAIKRSGYKNGFWEIYNYLPRETRSYVPQFMAVHYVMEFSEEHNLYNNRMEVIPEFKEIEVNQYFNLDEFSKKSQACMDDLLKLNPEIKRNVLTENHNNYKLRVPLYAYENIEENKLAYFDAAKKKGKEELNYKPKYSKGSSTAGKSKIVYTVRSGDVLGSIAQRYHVRLSDLRRWNGISSNNMIRVGQRLAIYKNPSYFKSNKPVKTSVVASKPVDLPKGKVYTVQEGDTLWGISKKYNGLTVEAIKKLNNLTNNSLKPGMKLKLS